MLVHRHPACAEAVVDVLHRAHACLLHRLLTRGDLGVEGWRHAVAVGHRVVQLPLGVGEKVFRRSCFGPGAGHAGDVGLRAGRRGVVLAARDDERFVALTAGLIDRGVECGACLARAVELGRSLRDGGCGVGAACGPLIENPVDRAGEQYDGCEFTDDGADGDRDGGASGHARPAARRVAGYRAGDRTDQQAEGECQRHG